MALKVKSPDRPFNGERCELHYSRCHTYCLL